jgi:hypothetical protein
MEYVWRSVNLSPEAVVPVAGIPPQGLDREHFSMKAEGRRQKAEGRGEEGHTKCRLLAR